MLIIYTHPNKLGFSGYFLKKVVEELDQRNIDYEILDLYEMKYDPVLKAREHYTSGHKEILPENQEIQAKIAAAQQLIFIHLIWWQSIPAILKGFFDRVFTPGFAFYYKDKFPQGMLTGKKAVVFTHSAGMRFYTKFFTGDRALKMVVKDVLEFCGIEARGFAFGMAQRLNERKKQKVGKMVHKGMRFLF